MAVRKAKKKEVYATPAKVVPTFRIRFVAGLARKMNGRLNSGHSQG